MNDGSRRADGSRQIHRNRGDISMPQFVIEREIPGVGKLPAAELEAMAARTKAAAENPGSSVQWLYSFVSDDKTYCVYLAPDADVLRQCSEMAGMPVTRVSRITSMLDAECEGVVGP
jgi:hypothetical protein